MNRVIVVALGLALCSVSVLAGEFLMNEEVAYGLRVTFSEPVMLGYFGDVLTVVSPRGEAAVFTFSGAELPPWVGHGLAWTPATARITSYEWLSVPPLVEIPEGGLTREDLMNLGRPPTYEEIMSVIAEYPGEDEPLYEPAPGESIWLTDLEGHADIYDNDSIRINYADWFDRSQVETIDVYRNGVKMRFLPNMLDVLTNEQMKTFDGNPLEHTPASSHTDHAITGYEFRVATCGDSGLVLGEASIEVHSLTSPLNGYRFANVGHLWYYPILDRRPESHTRGFLRKIADLGFDGISIEVNYFLEGSSLNRIIRLDEVDQSVHPWLQTAPPSAIRRMIRIAGECGLDVDVRFSIWISDETKQTAASPLDRCCFVPRDVPGFFASYRGYAVELARIAEEEGADFFTPIVELHGLMGLTREVIRLLDELDEVFSGRLIVEDHFSMILQGLHEEGKIGRVSELSSSTGAFWDWTDEEGHGLIIGLNPWPLGGIYETSTDQRYTVIAENAFGHWAWAVWWLRSIYPAHDVVLAEVGAFNVDGGVVDWPSLVYQETCTRDDQELADTWRALFDMMVALDLNGCSVWAFTYLAYSEAEELRECRVHINDTAAERTLSEFLKR